MTRFETESGQLSSLFVSLLLYLDDHMILIKQGDFNRSQRLKIPSLKILVKIK